jgi:Mannosyltransferase (PIG-V)
LHSSSFHLTRPSLQRDSAILTERWDANWYRDIAQRGYRFDGDGSVQQNVAWPFLFPLLVKGVAVAWRLPAASAMIGLNAVLLLAALLLLFAIGRASGLTHSLSLVAPAWLSFNPFAFFVVGGFSEPLFLTLEFLIALLILHRKYGISALMLALLTATRFVGLINVGWVVITVWYDTSLSRLGRLWRIAVASGAGLLGIVADVAIKGAQTGYPSAAFVVRKSWQVTRLSVLGGVLHPYTLFSGVIYWRCCCRRCWQSLRRVYWLKYGGMRE